MGASISNNVVKIVTKAILEGTSEIVRKNNVNIEQTLWITVEDVSGDINIRNNTFSQQANVNFRTLSDEMSNNHYSAQIDEKISQSIKQMVSGFNPGNIAYMKQSMDNLIDTAISIKNTSVNECIARSRQSVRFDIKSVDGSVVLSDNVVNQINRVVSECINTSLHSFDVTKRIEQSVDQVGISEIKGLDLNFLAMIGLVVVGGALGITIIGRQFVFPLIILSGGIPLWLYFTNENKEIVTTSFVEKIYSEMTNCNTGKVQGQSIESISPKHAEDACLRDPRCQSYEWANNTATLFQEKMGCVPLPKRREMRPPVYSTTANEGDAYLDVRTGDLFFRVGEGWKLEKSIPFEKGIDLGTTEPQNGKSDIDVWLQCLYGNIIVWKKTDREWKKTEERIRGAGMKSAIDVENLKAVGVAEKKRDKKYLMIGILLITVGLLGVLFVKSDKNKKNA